MMVVVLQLLLACSTVVDAYANGFPHDSTSDQPFICEYRSLAWEFAKKIQPAHDASITFDALMLGSLCNKTHPARFSAPPLAPTPSGDGACDVFVAVGGDDTHAGTTFQTAKATLQAGIVATRKLQTGNKTLCVSVGTFYLDAPLELTGADSGLKIQGETPNDGRNGKTWISGAVVLQNKQTKLQWEKYKVAPAAPGKLNMLENTNNQQGCAVGDPSPIASGGCGCYSNSSSAAECEGRCEKMGEASCKSYAWSPPAAGRWSSQCCIHADDKWHPTTTSSAKGHVCGRWAGGHNAVNVWKAALPAELRAAVQDAGGHLRVNGVRSSRARFPDSNPEIDIWPHGWVPNAETWLPAKPPSSKPQFVSVLNKEIQSRNLGLAAKNQSKPYSGGIGGPCEVFSPPFSYWCSAKPAGGGGFQYYVPSGMKLPSNTFPAGLEPTR